MVPLRRVKKYCQWLLGIVSFAAALGGIWYLFADWLWHYAGL